MYFCLIFLNDVTIYKQQQFHTLNSKWLYVLHSWICYLFYQIYVGFKTVATVPLRAFIQTEKTSLSV